MKGFLINRVKFHINEKVRIKDFPDYSYDEKFPSLAPGSVGRVIDTWSKNNFNRQETHIHVKFDCGNVFPFYLEELEKI